MFCSDIKYINPLDSMSWYLNSIGVFSYSEYQHTVNEFLESDKDYSVFQYQKIMLSTSEID